MGREIVFVALSELLAYCANFERDKVKGRTAGIKLTMNRRVKFGRTVSLSKEQFLYHYDSLQKGDLSVTKLCEKFGIPRKTFYNLNDKYLES